MDVILGLVEEPKKFRYIGLNGEKKIFRGRSNNFSEYLIRNSVNLIDQNDMGDSTNGIVLFSDISSLTDSELKLPFATNYVFQASDAQMKFKNANDKVQAWTDSLEVEAGNALSKCVCPISAGLFQRTHSYQVFAHHKLETALRERDGFFVDLADKAALLVSVKARFGSAEQNELLADLSYGSNPTKFVLSDWMFQTEKKEMKTLAQMPDFYPNLRGIKELDFFGVAVSPLFDPTLPEHPRIIRFGREIHHEFQATAALGTLVAAKISSKLARKFSF
jgi:hypothetical protein